MRKIESKGKKIIMLFSMSFLPYQGRYLRVYNEAKTLVEAGMDVTIIAWDRDCRAPKKEVIDGIKVERIWSRAGFQSGPSNIFNIFAFYLRLLPMLLRKEADVIHCFNLDTILPGLFAATLRGKRAILDLCEPSYYTNWPRRYRPIVDLLQFFERILPKRFDYLLVHSLYQIRKFRRYGVLTLEQIGSYPNRSLILDEVKRKNVTNATVVIGRIGSIYKNNGIEEMVYAFRRLTSVAPHARLLLAGRVFEEFRETFVHLISTLGDTVEVIGEFSPTDLSELYDKIDISLQLSRRTNWFKDITPTKFFETLARGVPVVTSDIGDLSEIIEEHNCGLIVDETDSESVFLGLKMLVENPSLRFEMASNGLHAIQDKYNWDLMGQKLLGVYESLQPLRVNTKDSTHLEGEQC